MADLCGGSGILRLVSCALVVMPLLTRSSRDAKILRTSNTNVSPTSVTSVVRIPWDLCCISTIPVIAAISPCAGPGDKVDLAVGMCRKTQKNIVTQMVKRRLTIENDANKTVLPIIDEAYTNNAPLLDFCAA